MGNVALCGAKEDGEFVTVLRGNGSVLTFYNPMLVADLLHEYPGHFVCHSSSLLLLHEGKILPPQTILTPGETYFLLPFPRKESNSSEDPHAPCRGQADSLQQQEQQQWSGTMRFTISNELFAKILSGSMREENLSKSRRRSNESTPLIERLKSLHSNAAVTAKWSVGKSVSPPMDVVLLPAPKSHQSFLPAFEYWTNALFFSDTIGKLSLVSAMRDAGVCWEESTTSCKLYRV